MTCTRPLLEQSGSVAMAYLTIGQYVYQVPFSLTQSVVHLIQFIRVDKGL